MPPRVGGEGMDGNRIPVPPQSSTSDAGEHGHPEHASRRAHHPPLGVGVQGHARYAGRPTVEPGPRPLAGVCLHRAGNQDRPVTNNRPRGVDRLRPFRDGTPQVALSDTRRPSVIPVCPHRHVPAPGMWSRPTTPTTPKSTSATSLPDATLTGSSAEGVDPSNPGDADRCGWTSPSSKPVASLATHQLRPPAVSTFTGLVDFVALQSMARRLRANHHFS
jgi:hypothetical protein